MHDHDGEDGAPRDADSAPRRPSRIGSEVGHAAADDPELDRGQDQDGDDTTSAIADAYPSRPEANAVWYVYSAVVSVASPGPPPVRR